MHLDGEKLKNSEGKSFLLPLQRFFAVKPEFRGTVAKLDLIFPKQQFQLNFLVKLLNLSLYPVWSVA